MPNIILLDTETTSLEPNSRLVQLAYKNLDSGETVNEYFKPPVAISIGAMATHHITNEMIADKPEFIGSKTQQRLQEVLNDGILVAHNAMFDLGILENEGVTAENYIDTLRVTKHLMEAERYDLQYLRYLLHLEAGQATAHDALGDITILEQLFLHLAGLLKDKLQLATDEEAYDKMRALSNEPVLINKIWFGKYRGKTFAEIKRLDPGYLEWLHGSEASKKEEEQDEELIYTLKKHLYLDKT